MPNAPDQFAKAIERVQRELVAQVFDLKGQGLSKDEILLVLQSLDMEDIIFKKAFAFLESKYDENVAKAFEESLLQAHDLDFSSQTVEMQDTIEVPLAVGASGGDGGGAV